MPRVIISTLILFVVLAACELNNPKKNPGGGETVATINTITFGNQSDGSFLFETNDPANIGSAGKTFFSYDDSVTENGAFVYTVQIIKRYGNQNGGFGLIFQRVDSSNFWVFNIDVNGYYYLAKIVDGNVTAVFSPPWKFSNQITEGYGTSNIISVVFDGSTNYEILANENSVVSFTDNGDFGTALRNGSFGVDVVVMSSEQFPQTPVSVKFKVLEPLPIELSLRTRDWLVSRNIGAR